MNNVEIYWFAHVNSINAFIQIVNMCKMSVLDVQLFGSLQISRTTLLLKLNSCLLCQCFSHVVHLICEVIYC